MGAKHSTGFLLGQRLFSYIETGEKLKKVRGMSMGLGTRFYLAATMLDLRYGGTALIPNQR